MYYFICTWHDTAIKNSMKSCLHLFLKYWVKMLLISLEYIEELSLPSEDYWSCSFKISRIAMCCYYTFMWVLLGKLEREFSYSEPAECCREPDVCQLLGRADQSKPTFAGFKVSTLSLNTLTIAIKSCYHNYFALHLSMKSFQSLSFSLISCEIRLSNLSLSHLSSRDVSIFGLSL